MSIFTVIKKLDEIDVDGINKIIKKGNAMVDDAEHVRKLLREIDPQDIRRVVETVRKLDELSKKVDFDKLSKTLGMLGDMGGGL